MAAPNPDSRAQSTTVNRRIVLNARPRGAPTAADLIGLLQGKNFGKLVVQLAHE
jgi:hypothetical protein